MATLTITIGDFKVNVDWLREYDAATPWLDETDRLGFDDGEGELPPFPDESEDEELRAHIGAWAMRAQLPLFAPMAPRALSVRSMPSHKGAWPLVIGS